MTAEDWALLLEQTRLGVELLSGLYMLAHAVAGFACAAVAFRLAGFGLSAHLVERNGVP